MTDLSVFFTESITLSSNNGSMDISYTFQLLYFVKKKWKYPSDITLFFDVSLTVKAAPHECITRTGQP